MIGAAGLRHVTLVLALIGLAACDVPTPPLPPVDPPVTPTPPATRSEASFALERHYARLQTELRDAGKLRRSDDAEAPSTSRQLVADFERIALFREYSASATGLARGQTESVLQRWTDPVRIGVNFGETVDDDRQSTDRATLASLVGQLRRATKHPVTVVDSTPNLHVFILHEDERRAIGPRLRAIAPSISTATINDIATLPRSTLCYAFAMYDGADTAYTQAVVIVRAEHPDILRKSCIHEEIAQALGLPNDSDAARPSIFNDDEEFAYLTRHDEYLLRMLYDPRLSVGMTRDDVTPIIAPIAQDVLGIGF